jgi:(R,R)-butanediol dehydrogenase / meso-butanediol dehydrogenase / diacetyl reductase
MRALTIADDRSLQETEFASPLLVDGWVRIDVAHCAICGSDLHLRRMPHIAGAGTVLGHEFSGWVSEISAGERRFKVGDQVVVWPKAGCGGCGMCQSGENHLCEVAPWRQTSLGLGTRPGAYAESIVVPAYTVFPVPSGLPLEHAALTEPLSCGVHAMDRSGVHEDDTVVILGGGVIGFLIAHALKFVGVDRVVVIEPNGRRRQRLIETGLVAMDPASDQGMVKTMLGGQPSVVFECVGSTTALSEAIHRVKVGGTVVALGVNERPATLDSVELITKEIRIVSSFAQNRDAFAKALRMLADGAIPVSHIITDVVPLNAGVSRIMDEMMAGQGDHQVVLIRPLHEGRA